MIATIESQKKLDVWQEHHRGPLPPESVRRWVSHMVAMCLPDRVYWCNGSADERDQLMQQAEKCSGCCSNASSSKDRPRCQQRTYICQAQRDPSIPEDIYLESGATYQQLRPLFRGCMKGRTMYVVPFVMGPLGSPLAKVGVQLTDSVDLAISMGVAACTGDLAWRQLGSSDDFTRCLHSLGSDHPQRQCVCHFPMDNTIWSFGSGS